MSARHARPTRAQARAGQFALQPQAWVSPDRVTEPALPYSRGASETAKRRPRRLVRVTQQLVATSVLVTAAGFIGLASSGETFALWSDSATLPGTVISTEAGELEVGGSLPPFTNALPGEQRHYAFALENTSGVDMVVTTRLASAVAHFDIRSLIIGASEDCGTYNLDALPALTTVADPTGSLIHGHEQLQVCAVVTALPEVEPQDAVEFLLLLEGVQAS